MTKGEIRAKFYDIKRCWFEWRENGGRPEDFIYDGVQWRMTGRAKMSKSGKTKYWSTYFLSDDMEISKDDTGHAIADHGFQFYVGPRR